MEKFRKYLTKKEYILFVISLMIIGLSSFSYAFFLSVDNREEDIITTECFKSTFEDSNDINLDKAYPMSDTEGSRLTPYTFTIKNLCNKAGEYQVNIETKEESSLSTSYLRYKLDNYPSDILGNQLEVQEYINENIKESRAIDAGVILPNEEKTYNLRLWVDENSTVSQSANKIYKGKVVVKTLENKEPYQNIILHSNVVEIQNNEIVRVKQRKLGNLPEIQKVGYTFEGWFLEEEYINEVDENTVVTSSMNNLYAKVTPNTNTPYTVEHYQMDTDGNYPSEPFDVDNLEGTTDTQVTPSTRTYEGFTSPNAEEINVDGDGNKVLKYYYTRNRYTVTYSSKGIVTPESEELYYGELANIPTPIRYGYTFDGWFDAASGGNEYSTLYVVTGPTTMYGQWTEKTYTLTINPNGGSIGGTTSTITRTLKYSDVSDIATPTRSSYTFVGFNELLDSLSSTALYSIGKYDWNSNVTVSSQSKSSDNPLSGTSNEIKINNPGTAASQPGLGGFVQSRYSAANRIFAHVFVAKLPVGYYFHNANNSLGTGSSTEWLTSNEGTGKWQTYVYKVTSGSSGTFSNFGHVYVSSDLTNNWSVRNAETHSYTAYLAYSNIFDITNNNNGIGQLDGSATLTATWVTPVTNFAFNGSTSSSGSIQSYRVLANGVYKLEVWGAQGGSNGATGGKGGYEYGNFNLPVNSTIYIGVGGQGLTATNANASGGYNGGGTARGVYTQGTNHIYKVGAGGGATHMAINSNRGILQNYSSYKSEVLIVAGGGGGTGGCKDCTIYNGGNGGGTSGTAGTDAWLTSGKTATTGSYGAQGGTQSRQGIGRTEGGFGYGAASSCNGGGGAGYYGGSSGTYGSGGGGSGYVNTTYLVSGTSGATTGNRTGNGYARITLVSLS